MLAFDTISVGIGTEPRPHFLQVFFLLLSLLSPLALPPSISVLSRSPCTLRLLSTCYLHSRDRGWAGGQGCGQLRYQGVGGVAAGGVSAFPVGLQVISHMLTCILQLVLI